MRVSFPCLLIFLWSTAALSEEWKEIKPPLTRQYAPYFFERVAALETFADASRWQAAQHGESAPGTVSLDAGRNADEKALRVHYELAGREGLEYVDIAGNVPLPDDVTAVGLWIKGGAHPLPARLRVLDANGECYQYNLQPLQPGKWILSVVSLDAPGELWGGDRNGHLNRPLRVTSIIFEKLGTGLPAQGDLWIADLASYRLKPERMQPHGLRLFVPPEQKFLVYEPSQPIRVAVALRPEEQKNLLAEPVPITATLVDPFGNVLQQQKLLLRDNRPLPINVPIAEAGAYDLRIRLAGREEDWDAPWADFRFAVLSPLPEQTEESPFGVMTHFAHAWPRSIMPLIVKAGIKYIRDEIYWSSVEQQKGQFHIEEKFRRYVPEAQQLGLEPLIILAYGNKYYDEGDFPTSPAAREGFARYAATIAREFPTIRYFEIWNEWTVGVGMQRGGKPADYPPLFLAAAQAVRAVRPDATIIGVGGELASEHLPEMLAQGAGAAMDAFSMHPYMYPYLPGEFFRQTLALAQSRAEAAAGKKLPLWITEIGWPTHLGAKGSDWLHQAHCLVRALLLALAQGTHRIFWYDFKDDGLNLKYNEHNFGLVHHEEFFWAPKPAYVAYAQLIRMLQGRRLVKYTSHPTGLRFIFIGPHDRLIVWMGSALDKPRIHFSPSACVFDMFGRPIRHKGSLTGTGYPVYIVSPH